MKGRRTVVLFRRYYRILFSINLTVSWSEEGIGSLGMRAIATRDYSECPIARFPGNHVPMPKKANSVPPKNPFERCIISRVIVAPTRSDLLVRGDHIIFSIRESIEAR
jgi:hypothetical protein